jgi:hypothetical protein
VSVKVWVVGDKTNFFSLLRLSHHCW